METARDETVQDAAIWVCGKPRFLREALAQVLRETFGAGSVRQVTDLEPPALVLPPRAAWMIWFLNGKNDVASAMEKLVTPGVLPNILLIQSDGHAFVRRADSARDHGLDVSLGELLNMLRGTLPETGPAPHWNGEA